MLQADPDLPVSELERSFMKLPLILASLEWITFSEWVDDAYEAVKLVLTGGKAVVTVDSGDQDATIKINPGNKVVKARDGVARISLAAGTYTFEVSAFGYFSKTASIDIVAKEVKELDLSLEQAPSFTATFNVANAEGAIFSSKR